MYRNDMWFFFVLLNYLNIQLTLLDGRPGQVPVKNGCTGALVRGVNLPRGVLCQEGLKRLYGPLRALLEQVPIIERISM